MVSFTITIIAVVLTSALSATATNLVRSYQLILPNIY
jgi:hypothetical protein